MIGLLFFIPVEITSWFIGKEWINDIVNSDEKRTDEFEEMFEYFGDFSFIILSCIYMGNKLYYGKKE